MRHKSYTIKDLTAGYEKKDFSPKEIFTHYTDKISEHNKELNAYLSAFQFAEQKIIGDKPSESHSLYGVPLAVKDNILIDGTIATAGSKILKNYISTYDATVISKLRKSGALFLGKTNMDEFAMGSSTENSGYGITKNPHDKTKVPGGSSGGSAAAVAADMAVAALGSDTGGSIRQPASFCGVVGLKPTYGRISRHGLIAMASSLDQIGPITKNVEDAAFLMNVISGNDIFDSTTVLRDDPSHLKELDKSIKGLKVGIPKEYFGEGLDVEVKEVIERSISYLKRLDCEIVDVSLPHSEYAIAVYYIVMPSEVSANLSRFDGIRYGHSARGVDTLLETYLNSRAEGFGAEPKRRVMLGTYALSSGYYDAYYLKAQKVRALIRKDFDSAFEKVDVIVGPVSPTTAFKIGEKSENPMAMYLSDIYTTPINLAGLPAMSLPVGAGAVSGMPVGLQIIGKMFDESTILRTGYQLEKSYQDGKH